MLYRITILTLLLLNAVTASAKGGEPDLSKYKNDSAKIQAWANYCDYFVGNQEGAKEDYPGLIVAGKKGVQLFKQNAAKSLFNFYVGAGFEYSGISNDSALYYYQLSEQYAIKAKNIPRLMSTYSQMIVLGTPEQTEAIASKLSLILDTTKTRGIQISIITALYKYHRDKNQYEKAIYYALRLLEMRKEDLKQPDNRKKEPSNFINIGVQLTQIGDMYYRMGQLEKASEYLHEALAYSGTNYMDGASVLYNSMVSLFLDMKKMDSADIYYRKVYELKEHGYESKESISFANRSYAQYYTSTEKDLDKALSFALKAYQLSMEDGGDLSMLESNTVIGGVYFERKEYQNALKHLMAVPVEARDYDKDAYNHLQFLKAECYRALGDWKNATEYYRDYAFTKDTLLSEAGKKNIAEMEAKFQNKQKQQQIDEAKKQRFFLISGIVALLAILLLLYVNYVNKQRSAKILDAKNAALYEANKTKATLFSVISHDLRSPISQLYQYLQLQKDNPELLTEEMKQKHSERIGTATASLLETMEDMLVWSKTQMERFVPAIEPVQVDQLIQDTITLLGPDIEAKSLSVNNRIDKNAIVQSDTNLLKIILRNLLLNAIQYSTKDSDIEIVAEQAESGMTISIKDQGLGMSDDVIELLQKGDQNLSSNRKGLGWSLIKEMAGSIGATIDIQKNVPQGTIVSLNITNKRA